MKVSLKLSNLSECKSVRVSMKVWSANHYYYGWWLKSCHREWYSSLFTNSLDNSYNSHFNSPTDCSINRNSFDQTFEQNFFEYLCLL